MGLIQRQGYRVTMPAGLSGGRGGDFIVQRKSEDFARAMQGDSQPGVQGCTIGPGPRTAGCRGCMRRGANRVYICIDPAKTKGCQINAQTLDTLLNEARQTPDEDFLAVWEWAPKLLSKVKLTPPLCPACEAPMDELTVSSGPVWVCSQRPECRGRRCARKVHKPKPPAGSNGYANSKPQTTSHGEELEQPVVLGGRARTICPSTA